MSVGGDIDVRILKACSDASSRGEIEHGVESVLLEEAFERGEILDVENVELKARRAQREGPQFGWARGWLGEETMADRRLQIAETASGVGKVGKTMKFEPDVVIVIEVVDGDDLMAFRQEEFTDFGSNESSSTGDEE